MLDLRDMKQADINALLALGISPSAIMHPYFPWTCRGYSHGQHFEESEDGLRWFVFASNNDSILWQPETLKLATEWGRAFALGEELIDNPGATFDGWLRIFPDPVEWLRNNRQGIVILRWEWAFDALRDLPGVAVHERLLPAYRRHMKPSMPKLAVLPAREKAAA